MAKSLADLSAEKGFIDEATAQEHNKADEQAASEEMPIKGNAQEVQDNTESKTESEQAASGDVLYSDEDIAVINKMTQDYFNAVSYAIWRRILSVDSENEEEAQRLSEYIKEHEIDIRTATFELRELCQYLQAEIDELNAKEGNTTPVSIHDVLSCVTIYGEPITGKDGKPENNPFFDLIERAKKRKKSEQNKAEKDNAIKDIGDRLPTVTSKDYQYTFSNNLFRRTIDGKEEVASLENKGFMKAMFKAVMIDHEISRKNGTDTRKTHSIDLLAFARKLGKDINSQYIKKSAVADSKDDAQEQKEAITRAEARTCFVYDKLLVDLDNVWGTLPFGSTEYKLFSIEAYNPETGVLHFSSPLMDSVVDINTRKAAAQIESSKKPYLWYSELMHASAGNDRNPAAFEMTNRIIAGVEQRGITPDADTYKRKKLKTKDKTAVTWEITCQSLINDCPEMWKRLEKLPNASRKTQALKRAFTAMYKMLKTQTDLPNKYLDFTVIETIPTSKTLNAVITVRHYGVNPEFKKPIPPIEI